METGRFSLRDFVERLEDATGVQFKRVSCDALPGYFYRLFCNDGSDVTVFDDYADTFALVFEDVDGTEEYKVHKVLSKRVVEIASSFLSKFFKEHSSIKWGQPYRLAKVAESRRYRSHLIKESEDFGDDFDQWNADLEEYIDELDNLVHFHNKNLTQKQQWFLSSLLDFLKKM